ncbi:MAG: sigma-54 dependent transcriptional regulator [Ignavibacteriales bacterium]|nr:sigma-54 dependent transcriptional regulator [Ignavibacteriales bacterium]
MAKGKILVVEDEDILAQTLDRLLTDEGYQVSVCLEGEKALSVLSQTNPDIVMSDIYLGEQNGLRLLKQMREQGMDMPVIMMTAFADISLAVQAMKDGASDFITKPLDFKHLCIVVEKTMKQSMLQRKVRILEEELGTERSRHGIVGNSLIIRRLLQTAERLSQGEQTTVLLEGESGTGKELFARYVAQKSLRADKPFITINCGAIPKDLAESEFFGYEKGAFTGATERMKQGRFELANGGTILLDEIGELSLDMQVKLLRVLDEHKYYRLGGTKEISVDVRVIAATNRNLVKEVEAGRFREDLYYRLNVAVLKIPPLRERKDDIAPLAYTFLQEFSKKFGKPAPKVSQEAIQFLEQNPWKGNVRELKNALERVMLLCDAPLLGPEQFVFLRVGGKASFAPVGFEDHQFALQIPGSGIAMKEVLRELILKTLAITSGNQVQAAKILGITRSKLRYRMEQLSIEPEQRSYKISA